jgi:hypothetical protein
MGNLRAIVVLLIVKNRRISPFGKGGVRGILGLNPS